MPLSDRLRVLGYRLCWWLGANFANSRLQVIGVVVSSLQARMDGPAHRRLRFNLSRALNADPNSEIVRQTAARTLRNYARYYVDMFSLGQFDNAAVIAAVEVHDEHHLADAVAGDTGTVLPGAHFGNYDWAAAWAAARYGNLCTVGERLEPVELFDAFAAARSMRGMEVLPHVGGERPVTRVLLERLRSGGMVALLADRDLSSSGVEVKLFGFPTTMPSGPARLAQVTGASLVPWFIRYEGNRHVLQLLPAIETQGRSVGEIMQEFADLLAETVQAHPENWFMLSQVWPDHPKEWGGR